MSLQELATDLKQELAEKLVDLDVVKFTMYPVKVYLLVFGGLLDLDCILLPVVVIAWNIDYVIVELLA